MSDNLNLRVFEKTDLDFLHRLYNNPEIMAYWFEDPFYSKSALETSFEKNLNNPRIKSFILQNNDETFGLFQLFFIYYIHRKCDFPILIDPLHKAKSMASKQFTYHFIMSFEHSTSTNYIYTLMRLMKKLFIFIIKQVL